MEVETFLRVRFTKKRETFHSLAQRKARAFVERLPATMAHIAERVFKNVISIPEDGPPSEIRKFYAGKSIFMTGATGFMGQAYVEKILRDCPELKRLYVLIRGRKGESPRERTKKFFQHIVSDFGHCHFYPHFMSLKILIVTQRNGDLCQIEFRSNIHVH